MKKQKKLEKITIWGEDFDYQPLVELYSEDIRRCSLRGISESADFLDGICAYYNSVERVHIRIDTSRFDKDKLEKVCSLDFYVAGISFDYENEPRDFYTISFECDWQKSIELDDKSNLIIQFSRENKNDLY